VQGDYFRRSGVQAWSSGDVPHTLTSGPLVARAYAQVVEGFVADCANGRFGPVDPAEPLYVVELGSGTGRLSFHFLRALDVASVAPFHVVYILTDLAESNVDFWRSHPRLAPLFESGRLDLATFDATRDAELRLERAGVVLRPGDVANPVVAVANYLFDVIPQDLFAVERGRLFEELVALVATEPDLAPDAPDFLRRVWLATTRERVGEHHYGEADLDTLLHDLARLRGEEDAAERFLFPAPALRCVRHLGELSRDRLLLLVGERPGGLPEMNRDGDRRDQDGTIRETPEPGEDGGVPSEAFRPAAVLGLSVHGGSFSLPVDLDAIGRFAGARGGTMLLPSALPAGLLIAAILLGATGRASSTAHRFALAVDDAGPEDLFLTMRPALGEGLDELPLAILLALLRVGGYDAYLFRTLHGALAKQLADAQPGGVEETVRTLDEVWERYYALDDETDVAFGIAALLAPAGRYAEALVYLARSRAIRGPQPLVAFNAALCHALLGDREAALVEVDEALSLEPGMDQALKLRAELDNEVRPG
jgi:hypothetical protein